VFLPPIYNVYQNIDLCFLVSAVFMVVFCLLPFFMMVFMDKKAEAYDKKFGIVSEIHEETDDFDLG